MESQSNRQASRFSRHYCLIVIAVGLLLVLLIPYPLIDVIIGGFVGATIAQFVWPRSTHGLVLCGFAGGLIAIWLSFLLITVSTGKEMILFLDWREVIAAAVLLLYSCAGITMAWLVKSVAFPQAQTET